MPTRPPVVAGLVPAALLALTACGPGTMNGPADCGHCDPHAATFQVTGSMATPRKLPIAEALPDGRVLVAGGSGGAGGKTVLDSAELYDPDKGTWSPTGSLSSPRESAASVRLADGRILVVGGDNATSDDLTTAEIFDSATGRFTPTAGSMMQGRQGPSVARLSDGTVLVASGFATTGPGGPILGMSARFLTSAELFDPATGKFQPAASLATGRVRDGVVLLPDNQVAVIGGSNLPGGEVGTAELYDPTTGKFSPGGTLLTSRLRPTATVLPNNQVLVAGGSFHETALGSAELYDGTAHAFTLTGSLTAARVLHTATLLHVGSVLLVGGDNNGEGLLARAELYDPQGGSFSPTGKLNTARENHVAVRVPDGRVLIAGGTDRSGPLASAELYTPPCH